MKNSITSRQKQTILVVLILPIFIAIGFQNCSWSNKKFSLNSELGSNVSTIDASLPNTNESLSLSLLANSISSKPHIFKSELSCSDYSCVRIIGQNFPRNCAVRLFQGVDKNGSLPIMNLQDVTCDSSKLVTFRIPKSVLLEYPSLNIAVYDKQNLSIFSNSSFIFIQDPQQYLANINLSNILINDSKFPSSVEIGSNFLLMSLGELLEYPGDDAWYGLNGRKPIQPLIGFFHKNPQKAIDQFIKIRQSGQKVISIMIWFCRGIENNISFTHGHCVANLNSNLIPQHLKNLENVIKTIEILKFSDLTIRFAPQGESDSSEWTSWNEKIYQENWNFIVNLRKKILEKKGKVKVTFDLGVENGGIPDDLLSSHKGLKESYTRRLITDYNKSFGMNDSYGVSIAWDSNGWTHGSEGKGRIFSYLKLLKDLNIRPKALALDIYDREYEGLIKAQQSIAQSGVANNLPIIIQEAFYNDRQAFDSFMKIKELGTLNIKYLFQWPVQRGKTGHFSLAVPSEARFYQGGYITSAGLGCNDFKCIWINGFNFTNDCEVNLYPGDWSTGEQPVGIISLPSCNNERHVTFRIPESIYKSYKSLNLIVTRKGTKSWSNAFLINLTK